MAMNRETKRLLQRQGQLGEDGEPKAQKRQARPAQPAPHLKEERTKPKQFVREVRGEMRKVAWPTRAETMNYSAVVFITILVLTAFIALLDFASSKAVLWIFQ